MILLALIVIPSLLLALPALSRRCTWPNFFRATGMVFAIGTLPLGVFLLSAFLVPEWKGACPHGWLDCFHLGKLALSPLVLWATAALYAVEVLRVESCGKPWIALGLLTGALVSGGCLAVGVFLHIDPPGRLALWLAVPAYVFVWHTLRSVQILHEAGISFLTGLATVASSAPFWFASVWWAKKSYLNLPDHAPECFVVTAAGRGHKKIVGPFVEFTRHCQPRRVNQQLVTFWRFENVWHTTAPRSHGLFRLCYNRFGPVIARNIRSPWTADVVFLCLKPVEWAVQAALKVLSSGK